MVYRSLIILFSIYCSTVQCTVYSSVHQNTGIMLHAFLKVMQGVRLVQLK